MTTDAIPRPELYQNCCPGCSLITGATESETTITQYRNSIIIVCILAYGQKRLCFEQQQTSKNQINSSLYLRYYTEVCNKWHGPIPRLGAWAIQLHRNVTAMASCWQHCVCADMTSSGIKPQTLNIHSLCLTTELTGH